MNKSSIYNTLILLPFYWLFSGMMVFKDADKSMVAFVIIAILASLYGHSSKVVKHNFLKDKVLWVTLIATGYAIFSYYYNGTSSREVRSLLCVSLYLLFFPRQLFTTSLLQRLAIIGCFSAFIASYYFSQYLSIPRAQWSVNAIPLATIAAVVNIIAIVALLTTPAKKITKALLFLSVIFGFGALMLTQTRGIWVSYIPVLLFLGVVLTKSSIINFKVISILTIVIAFTAISARPVLSERINKTQEEIQKIQAGNFSSSIGLRFQMWALSPQMISDSWFLGQGKSHQNKFKELTREGAVSSSLAKLNPAHYHNQYIDKIIKSGVVGLSILLALLFLPLKLVQRQSMTARAIVSAISILYMTASLTDVPFNHPETLLLYLTIICILTSRSTNQHCSSI